MTDSWRRLEVSVDNSDGFGAFESKPVNIAFSHRRQIYSFQFQTRFYRGDSWPHEDVNAHGCVSNTTCARRPGAYPGTSIGSRAGTITRTTGNPNSRLVRSITTTCWTPAFLRHLSSCSTSSSRVSPSQLGTSRSRRVVENPKVRRRI